MSEVSPTPPRRFTFDNEFEGGAPIAGPYKRSFSAAEVEELTQRAKAEGMATAMARVEAQTARALTEMADAARAALPTLAAAAHEHRAGAAELALACARQIADAACERFPEAPLQAALAALAREVEATPRLTLRAPPALVERLQAALAETAEAIGYPGQILARADPSLAKGAFVFDWGDGSAAFDPAGAAARVAEALEGALAAEGLHAEALALPSHNS
ncbi:MAG TPA: flagellar assembly protein FliH [Caulobacteraceae bacterium]|jgi:flagellar assembly protein FliH|nr:flagellar assembly protein FliH [Caulobacteraceae bacterium]